jgi:starch phosphorylase
MKSALNGGLNLSVRDGWWDEWFDGENGWAIPSADDVADPARRDELESAAMYDLLEQVVAPLFYDTGADGMPQRWLEMVAHTLAVLGPRAQAARMVRQYVETLYVPAARSSRVLAADHGEGAFAAARELAAWKQRLKVAWPAVRIEHIEADGGDRGPGEWLPVRASVALGELSPEDVRVEVICGRVNDEEDIVEPAAGVLAPDGPATAEGTVEDPAPGSWGLQASGGSRGSPPGVNTVRYAGEARLGRPGPFGYTVRVVPRHPLLDSTAELGLVTYPDAPEGMTNGDLR